MSLRPLVVTGPIGSGKSTVSKLIESFGALRVDLDQLSREVLETREGVNFVEDNWPEAVDGSEVNRAALATIVFADLRQLRRLEEFIHPLVMSKFQALADEHSTLVVEVSVPFSISIRDGFVVLVDVPHPLRFQRLLERGMNPIDIEARTTAQPARADWLRIADSVLSNKSSEVDLSQETEALWAWWVETRL